MDAGMALLLKGQLVADCKPPVVSLLIAGTSAGPGCHVARPQPQGQSPLADEYNDSRSSTGGRLQCLSEVT